MQKHFCIKETVSRSLWATYEVFWSGSNTKYSQKLHLQNYWYIENNKNFRVYISSLVQLFGKELLIDSLVSPWYPKKDKEFYFLRIYIWTLNVKENKRYINTLRILNFSAKIEFGLGSLGDQTKQKFENQVSVSLSRPGKSNSFFISF